MNIQISDIDLVFWAEQFRYLYDKKLLYKLFAIHCRYIFK